MIEKFNGIRPYNFWNGNTLDLGFFRKHYSDILLQSSGGHLVKVLTGQRRAGKSYVLRQVAARLIESGVPAENILMINMELAAFDFISDHEDLNTLIQFWLSEFRPQGMCYIFIDEVQMIREWEKTVNSYSQDYSRNFDLFISGSNSKMLSGELATLLSGRYVEFSIYPFGYNEYVGITGKETGMQSYLDFISTGGLPELFALGNEELRRNYVSSLKDTILLKDIVQRQNIRDAVLLDDIFVYLVNNASNLTSINGITDWFKAKKRKVSYEAVSNYIGYILDTFLFHQCNRYDVRGKETIAGVCKYYGNDFAFKNYLYPGYGYGTGYLLENAIYLELRRQGYEVYTGVHRQKEIDFVGLRGKTVIYIQCAYMLTSDDTIEREYAPLLAIPDNYTKIIVTLDPVEHPDISGIRHVQAWNFSGSI